MGGFRTPYNRAVCTLQLQGLATSMDMIRGVGCGGLGILHMLSTEAGLTAGVDPGLVGGEGESGRDSRS